MSGSSQQGPLTFLVFVLMHFAGFYCHIRYYHKALGVSIMAWKWFHYYVNMKSFADNVLSIFLKYCTFHSKNYILILYAY